MEEQARTIHRTVEQVGTMHCNLTAHGHSTRQRSGARCGEGSRRGSLGLIALLLLLLPHSAIAQDGKWVVDPHLGGVAQEKPLCKELLRHLNNYKGCPGNVIAAFPEFSSPPWQELEPKEHRDLIWRLLMYRGRADVYFRRGAAAKSSQIPDTPATRRAATEFVTQGGRLRIWRSRLFNDYAHKQSAPLGDQTIVELRQPFSLDLKGAESLRCDSKMWVGSTYIVTTDLMGPEPSVDGGTASLLGNGEILMYKESPYLVIGHGLVIRMQTSANLPDSYPLHYCGFRRIEGSNP